VHGFVSGKRPFRVNVVAGYCGGQMLGEYCYSGSMDSKRFEEWFCKHLLPETHEGDVVIMDNASYHSKKRLREYALVYKVRVIFLPPYSPDLNPIEHIWANLKSFLRNTKRQFESLSLAIYWYLVFGYS